MGDSSSQVTVFDQSPTHGDCDPSYTCKEVPDEEVVVDSIVHDVNFVQLGAQIGKVVDAKNEQYGSSFASSAKALALLYPDGIEPSQYKFVLLLARIWDKMSRVANCDPLADNENPFHDISGYGMIGSKEWVQYKESLKDRG